MSSSLLLVRVVVVFDYSLPVFRFLQHLAGVFVWVAWFHSPVVALPLFNSLPPCSFSTTTFMF